MQFGALVGNFGTYEDDPGVDGCLAVADEAERLGYDSVWVHDHVVMPTGVTSRYLYNETGDSPFRPEQFIYDPITVMAAIAGRTRASRSAPACSSCRTATRSCWPRSWRRSTASRMGESCSASVSDGCGEEFDALGIDDLWSHRGAVTDEFMAACIDLWTQDGPSSFDGRWVRYHDVGANPLPVQQPHIPIWVGGKTPAAHRRVARYGSGYHTVASTPAQVADEVATVPPSSSGPVAIRTSWWCRCCGRSSPPTACNTSWTRSAPTPKPVCTTSSACRH